MGWRESQARARRGACAGFIVVSRLADSAVGQGGRWRDDEVSLVCIVFYPCRYRQDVSYRRPSLHSASLCRPFPILPAHTYCHIPYSHIQGQRPRIAAFSFVSFFPTSLFSAGLSRNPSAAAKFPMFSHVKRSYQLRFPFPVRLILASRPHSSSSFPCQVNNLITPLSRTILWIAVPPGVHHRPRLPGRV